MRGAECGVWKMRGVENEECGKCGVWKMRIVENFNFPFQFQFSISISGEMRRNSVLTIKKKKRDESLHFKMRRAVMVISVVVFTNAPVLLSLRTTRRCKYVLDQDVVL